MMTKWNGNLQRYRQPLVADLAWAIGSTPLLTRFGHSPTVQLLQDEFFQRQWMLHQEWLSDLDKNPQLLLQWMDKENHKLIGKRFEALLSFWLSQSPFYQLLHHNVVLHNQANNTSGEIDFLVRNLETNELWHLEVACKYYLGFGATGNWSNWSNWIGPNGHDSLKLKMQKSFRQLNLCNSSEGRMFLKNHELPCPKPFLWLKGYFFYHYETLHRNVPPQDAHEHFNAGWYCYERELSQFAGKLRQWLLLPKDRWLSPFYSENKLDLLSGDEVVELCREYLHFQRKAPLLVQVEERDGVIMELSRAFVVHDAWPFFA